MRERRIERMSERERGEKRRENHRTHLESEISFKVSRTKSILNEARSSARRMHVSRQAPYRHRITCRRFLVSFHYLIVETVTPISKSIFISKSLCFGDFWWLLASACALSI